MEVAKVVLLPAVTTQSQTARAEDQISSPVSAPQLTMQSKAAIMMVGDWEHWQLRSFSAQPTADAADDKQETFKRRSARIG